MRINNFKGYLKICRMLTGPLQKIEPLEAKKEMLKGIIPKGE
jgi:hypothetical protein